MIKESHRYLDKKDDIYELNSIIDEFLGFDEVLKLHEFSQHLNTSRLQHSINVAYYSYRFCKMMNWDYISATRAGLLHDLFLYDWRTEKQPEGKHAFAHPIIALKNAKKLTTLNEIEEDAIVKHMWPLTIKMPKYKESFVVSFADKVSATAEIYESLQKHVGSYFSRAKSLVFGYAYVK